MNVFKLVIITAIATCIIACEKESDNSFIDRQIVAAKDYSIGERIFLDIQKVVEEAVFDEGRLIDSNLYFFGACNTISIIPEWADTSWPKTMEIDFGENNCEGVDGVLRKGKLTIEISDNYINDSSRLAISMEDFYVNNEKVEGNLIIVNRGRNISNNFEFDVNVSQGKITLLDDDLIFWNATRTHEWILGDTTTLYSHGLLGVCDDAYEISGTISGVNRNGLSYTAQITKPLRKESCCKWIASGKVELTPEDLETRFIDFGVSGCDNGVEIEIGGNVYAVALF